MELTITRATYEAAHDHLHQTGGAGRCSHCVVSRAMREAGLRFPFVNGYPVPRASRPFHWYAMHHEGGRMVTRRLDVAGTMVAEHFDNSHPWPFEGDAITVNLSEPCERPGATDRDRLIAQAEAKRAEGVS